jgi:16S rRNA G966 N2-methylase RsmD
LEINKLIDPEVQNFIQENLSIDSRILALKKNPFHSVSYSEIINQIIAKKKAKDKLPTWYLSKNIVYPEKISIEQTSSELTAQYKSSLLSGKNIIDCTGGFGIDDYYFSKNFRTVFHCEINSKLSKIVEHNFNQLGINNIDCLCGDSTEILNQLNQQFDAIYIDPSRRNDAKGKVFMLADCSPNAVELQKFYYQFTETILIKTAPILDLQAGLNELKNVAEIHIVALDNEVKEILWLIRKNYIESPKIITINIEKDATIKTEISTKYKYQATYSLPKKYVYEPNVSLLKSGKFEALSELFKLHKLHQHSHLYTSDDLIDFPGRRFKIDTVVPFQKKSITQLIQNQKLNVSTRNFPIKPDEIKKKYKISDGGLIYAFFTTNLNNEKIVLLCTKI